jgi:hypothetical protein
MGGKYRSRRRLLAEKELRLTDEIIYCARHSPSQGAKMIKDDGFDICKRLWTLQSSKSDEKIHLRHGWDKRLV